MKAVVVYESHWGNTAQIAKAIAEGIGPDTPAITTDQATADALAYADLVVVGAPVLGFTLATEQMRDSVRAKPGAPAPDLSRPLMRTWLDGLPEMHGHCASFETRLRFSPGGSTGKIDEGLTRAGCRPAGKPMRFFVTGTYGPLRDGELDRAKAWGAQLATAYAGQPVP